MRTLILVLLSFIPALLFAQPDSTLHEEKVKDTIPSKLRVYLENVTEYTSIEAGFGLSSSMFSDPFKQYFRSNYGFEYGTPLNTISLSITRPALLSGGTEKWEQEFNCHYSLNYRFAAPYKPSDTMSFALSVFDISIAAGYDLLFDNKKIDLPVRAGFDLGVANLVMNGESSTNPFLDFVVQVHPRVILGRLAISAKMELGLDLSSQSWKPYGNPINDPMAWKNHYALGIFSLGYVFR